MTLREVFENAESIEKINEETIDEGFKDKALGAIGGIGLALCLATAAGIPQKAILKHDINQIVKTMSPQDQAKFKQLYKMDEMNGTNRAGDFMVRFIDDTVENGGGTKMMKDIYSKMHGEEPQKKNFNY